MVWKAGMEVGMGVGAVEELEWWERAGDGLRGGGGLGIVMMASEIRELVVCFLEAIVSCKIGYD